MDDLLTPKKNVRSKIVAMVCLTILSVAACGVAIYENTLMKDAFVFATGCVSVIGALANGGASK